MNEPERILIVRLSHLGDVVSSLGALHALHAAFPRARIAWAVQPEYAELLEPLPGLERVIPFERHAGIRAWPRLWKHLRSFAPDLALDAQGNLKSAWITRLSGAKRRLGFAKADWRERTGALALTEQAPEVSLADGQPRNLVHPLERLTTLLTHLTGQGDFRTDPAVTAEEELRGAEVLTSLLGESRVETSDSAPLVLCHLSSPGDVRGWPLEHWSKLLERLIAGRGRVLVLSGPAEAELGAALERRHPAGPGLAHWSGQKGLRDLAGLFRAAAVQGASYVGCDSGPMHLAWACGLPVRVLEGPQSARRTGPWPLAGNEASPHRELRSSTPPSCAPCFARSCSHPEGPVCMTGIEPGDVARELLTPLVPAPPRQ